MVPESAIREVGRKSYVPVPLDVFVPGRALPFSLYSRAGGGGLKLACAAGDSLSSDVLQAWHRVGITVLYIDTAEHRLYQNYAESMLGDLAQRGDLSSIQKAQIYYKTTRELVREACASSNLEEMVGERREKWVSNMVSLICTDDTALDGILRMLSHDYYTYTHMVNVSVMVTGLAYRLGESDRMRLSHLASGGLLHDIGKMRVNPETLNKVGQLTRREWEELKAHPGLGLEFLHGRPDIKAVELLMVHQHHEKLDGSGYPLGLLGAEIATEAQMTAVVDIYDALTCKRPYRDAMSHEKALGILYSEAGSKINRTMVDIWKETIERARNTGA